MPIPDQSQREVEAPSVPISIVMATYNGARYLEQQLSSFAAQSRLPGELVITDDGSSDATAEIVERFAATAPFTVGFHRNPRRLGYNGNFARAIALAQGAIIFISDQDDVWYPTKIETVTALLDSDPAAYVVVNDQVIADEHGRETGRTVLENVRGLGKPDSWFGPGCCTAFKRDYLAVLAPFPGDTVAYDHWVNALSQEVGLRRLCEIPLQSYRRHGANASGSVFSLRRPGAADLIRAAQTSSIKGVDAIERKVTEIEAIIARFDERRDVLCQLSPGVDVDSACRALRDESESFAKRLDALRNGFAKRCLAVAVLYLRGGYRRFSGMRTALKDVVAA